VRPESGERPRLEAQRTESGGGVLGEGIAPKARGSGSVVSSPLRGPPKGFLAF